MSAAPVRVSATSRLAKEAVARLRAGKDKRGQKAFDLVAGIEPAAGPKASKHRNVKITDADGKFDSLKEHRRWGELKLLQRSGQIRGLRRQVKFDLVVNGRHVCAYVADHVYAERTRETLADGSVSETWVTVVEDVKSEHTSSLPDYRIKNKLMFAVHDITIREV